MKQNNPVPKNSSPHNSSFDPYRSALCVWHFCPSYIRPLVPPNTLVVSRAVCEWTETTGGGDDKTISLIHTQLWAATRTTEGKINIWPGDRFSLSYDVPTTAPGSCLSGDPRITFWELDICATAAGIDFEERYLVPVYRGAS